ncbi:hypothetical protein C8R48DRAFT_705997 [Suillus tomentosus]|nr:hypothetical protein C8R48DRAFT_705997 [Suillus tomentosus]
MSALLGFIETCRSCCIHPHLNDPRNFVSDLVLVRLTLTQFLNQIWTSRFVPLAWAHSKESLTGSHLSE